MKFIIALFAFQTVVLGFFGFRLLEIDTRIEDYARIAQVDAARSEGAITDSYGADRPTVSGPTAEEIRQIIREEIANFEGQEPVQSAAYGASDQTRAEPTSQNAAVSIHLKASLQNELDAYIGRGNIEPAEMANLQLKIARLPDQDRREMLSVLAKAMNAGDLEGEF